MLFTEEQDEAVARVEATAGKAVVASQLDLRQLQRAKDCATHAGVPRVVIAKATLAGMGEAAQKAVRAEKTQARLSAVAAASRAIAQGPQRR